MALLYLFPRILQKHIYYSNAICKLLTGFREWPLILRIFLGRPRAEIHLIRLRRPGLSFWVRGAMDVWSLKETFLDRFYERFGFPVGDGWKIVDVGAGIGDFTLFAANGHPENTVFAFEPFPPSFGLLEENLRLNGITNVVARCEAISGRTGLLNLDLSGGEPLQIQSADAFPPSDTDPQQCSVPSLSLADAFARLGLDHCDLLKLDCEGAEYEILFSAPDAIFERIDRIVMEYHDGVSKYNHEHLVAFLARRGYRVETFPNFVHAEIGYLRGLHALAG